MLEKVKMLANKRGMSIAMLEERAGIGNGTISRWDKSKPNLGTLEKVAKVLEIPISDLLSDY